LDNHFDRWQVTSWSNIEHLQHSCGSTDQNGPKSQSLQTDTCCLSSVVLFLFIHVLYSSLGFRKHLLRKKPLHNVQIISKLMWLEDCVTEAGPLPGGGRGRGFEWQYKEWQRYADRYSGTVSRHHHSRQSILSCYQGNRAQRHTGVSVSVTQCLLSWQRDQSSPGCVGNCVFIYLYFLHLLWDWMMKMILNG